jgi:predicted membrane protein
MKGASMRQRGSLFWGIVLILLAALLLFRQQGWIMGDIFGYLWPAIIVLFGIWLLIGALGKGRSRAAMQNISIPLESARSARIKMDHAAGRLNIRAGASSTELLNGDFGTEVDYKSKVEADQIQVKLRNSPHFWAWYPGESLDWDLRLNSDIPLNLKIDSGASASILDLTELKVVELHISTGASSTEVNLPANVDNTLVDIHSGAASLNIRVPMGVAARIKVKSGIASVNVDSNRFPRLDGGLYQSADYATAAHRADITIDTGVGSVGIK